MRRFLRAVRIAARDQRIPRWVRALALLGAAPVPGPLDEVVLLLVAPILVVFYRAHLREAWQRAA